MAHLGQCQIQFCNIAQVHSNCDHPKHLVQIGRSVTIWINEQVAISVRTFKFYPVPFPWICPKFLDRYWNGINLPYSQSFPSSPPIAICIVSIPDDKYSTSYQGQYKLLSLLTQSLCTIWFLVPCRAQQSIFSFTLTVAIYFKK